MTGTDNTGLGVSAFQNSFGGGSYNVGVGNTVLLNVRSGEANNAFGVGALEDITTGSNNVAVGYQSQGNSTLSNDNVTVGYHAGQNLGSGSIVGSQNVIIGSNASNLDILTNGCVTIGYNAENGSSLSRVNTVSIGMNTYSDGNHHCTIVGSGAGCTGLNNCLGSIALGDGANVQNVNGSMAIGYNCSVTAIGACNLGGGPSGNGICLGVNNPAPACTLSLVPSTTTPCCWGNMRPIWPKTRSTSGSTTTTGCRTLRSLSCSTQLAGSRSCSGPVSSASFLDCTPPGW